MAEIKIEGLSHVYSAGTPFENTALDNINLFFPPGELVGLMGHTGSGKSTLIQHMNALLAPSSGRVLCDGEDINADKHARKAVKQKVGLVFQYPEHQLFEETVYKDIAFGPGNMGLSREEIDLRVREAADFCGMEEDLFEKSPLDLSGGQKRRIAIAGVIAMRPDVLILDEPTAGLDPEGCAQILYNIFCYREKSGSTVIIVSHNMDDIARIADRLIVLNRGSVFMDGTPAEVFSEPDRLVSIGLSVPSPTRLFLALRERGIPLEGSVFTHEQLLEAILRQKEASKC